MSMLLGNRVDERDRDCAAAINCGGGLGTPYIGDRRRAAPHAGRGRRRERARPRELRGEPGEWLPRLARGTRAPPAAAARRRPWLARRARLGLEPRHHNRRRRGAPPRSRIPRRSCWSLAARLPSAGRIDLSLETGRTARAEGGGRAVGGAPCGGGASVTLDRANEISPPLRARSASLRQSP